MKSSNQIIERIQRIVFALACTWLVGTACSSENLDDEDSAKDSVEVNLIVTSRVAADDPESQIKSLRVYAFDGDRLVAKYENASVTGITHSFTMAVPESMITFYVIANEQSVGELKKNNVDPFSFSGSISLTDLHNITFSTLPTDVSNKGIPMTAIHETLVNKDRPITIDNLKRSVAKLSIYAVKKGSESAKAYMNRGVYLYNEPVFGYLFASQNTYKSDFNHKESNTTGTQTDGNNQQNGKIIISADWKNDTDGNIVFGNHEITKTFSPGMEAIPDNYQKLVANSIYLFANPNDKNDAATKENAYYLKFGWTNSYTKNNEEVHEVPKTSSIYLPIVNANDNIQLFAHISVTSTLINEFNWFVSSWIPAGGDIQFN